MEMKFMEALQHLDALRAIDPQFALKAEIIDEVEGNITEDLTEEQIETLCSLIMQAYLRSSEEVDLSYACFFMQDMVDTGYYKSVLDPECVSAGIYASTYEIN